MNADDLNFRVREDGLICCDDPEVVRAYVNAHDELVARIQERAAANVSTHTPGPWKTWLDTVDGVWRIDHKMPDLDNHIIVGFIGNEADARLIAAAPELYDALRTARAALAKAENRLDQ